MNRLAYQHSLSFQPEEGQSSPVLVQLGSAHDQLMVEIENLDRITGGERPELGEITTGRWHISQASLRRRSIVSSVFNFLASRLEGTERERLKMVQAADQQMMRRSARHVGDWTMQTISSDWRGYCRASRDIRAHSSSSGSRFTRPSSGAPNEGSNIPEEGRPAGNQTGGPSPCSARNLWGLVRVAIL